MRVVKEIISANYKITIFHWNNRYLIKFESGALEQTFKVSELDVSSESEVVAMLDDIFLKEVSRRFEEMAESLAGAVQRQQ